MPLKNPTTQEIIEFYDGMSTKWESGISDERIKINSYFLDDILKEDKRMFILDVGCGAGCMSRRYIKEGHTVFGIDISTKMIQLAKNRTLQSLDIRHLSRIVFIVRDITNLTNSLPKFDLVIANDVIEHTIDPEVALKNCIGLVADEGYIYITTPHPEYRKNTGMEGQPVDHVIEIGWLKEVLESGGLTIVKERGYGHDFGEYTTYFGVLAKKEEREIMKHKCVNKKISIKDAEQLVKDGRAIELKQGEEIVIVPIISGG